MGEEDRTYDPPAGETPDTAFERQWKMELLATVRRNLQQYYEKTGKPTDRTRYAIFAAYHFADRIGEQPTQAELADRFGVSRDLVRYALEEVQKRYERFLRQEIRDQVGSEDDIESEFQALLIS